MKITYSEKNYNRNLCHTLPATAEGRFWSSRFMDIKKKDVEKPVYTLQC